MKKTLILFFTVITVIFISSGCSKEEKAPLAKAFDYIDPIKISERITNAKNKENISVSEIYGLIRDCKGLTEAKLETVVNYSDISPLLEKASKVFNEDDIKIKAMSFNIRNGEYGNGRMELVLKTIMEEYPDVVGLQEAGDDWKPFLKENLPDDYVKLGHGRKELGYSEANYVLYKKDKFDLLESDTIWMTDTPNVCSVWTDPETGDVGFPRIMTYALLQRKSDGAVFVFANTHLETDQPAQNHQAYWLTQFLTEKFGNQYPIILTGDFNCTAGAPAYNTITEYGFNVTNTYGESKRTFQGYSESGGAIIDFCFANEYIPIRSYKVVQEKVNGQFISDHNAIVSELLILPEIE